MPEEQHAKIHEALGWSYDDTWVAIARLDLDAEKAAPEKAETGKRSWGDLSPSQQAGICCNEVAFQRFIGATDADMAAVEVRKLLGVKSRSELNDQGFNTAKWEALNDEYRAWLLADQHGVDLSEQGKAA